jgi:hypothetical protein
VLRKLRRDSGATADTRLGREADASLRRDPHWLCDARRLGALHARLGEALGEAEATAALLQAGCLHGLRDAAATLAAGWHGSGRGTALRAPRLSLALAPAGPDALEVAGGWRETHEAEGRLAALGGGRAPSCFASSGYVSGWLSGLFGVDVLALEIACAAAGAPSCRVLARPASAWRASGDARALALLERLDFADLRAGLAEDVEADDPPEELARSLDSELPVVHVWGPVMILPFSGADDSIATLESVGRDAAAREVSVVVLDLAGALLDPGGGALALERVLEAVEQRGADAVLAGVSPRSEAVVGELAARRGVLRRDLPQAIATAFQIADSRRRPC